MESGYHQKCSDSNYSGFAPARNDFSCFFLITVEQTQLKFARSQVERVFNEKKVVTNLLDGQSQYFEISPAPIEHARNQFNEAQIQFDRAKSTFETAQNEAIKKMRG